MWLSPPRQHLLWLYAWNEKQTGKKSILRYWRRRRRRPHPSKLKMLKTAPHISRKVWKIACFESKNMGIHYLYSSIQAMVVLPPSKISTTLAISQEVLNISYGMRMHPSYNVQNADRPWPLCIKIKTKIMKNKVNIWNWVSETKLVKFNSTPATNTKTTCHKTRSSHTWNRKHLLFGLCIYDRRRDTIRLKWNIL